MLESMCKSFIWSGLLSATSVRAAYGITARNILFVAIRCISAKIAQGGTILSDTHIDVCKGGHSPEERRAFTDILAHIGDKWTVLVVGVLSLGRLQAKHPTPLRWRSCRRQLRADCPGSRTANRPLPAPRPPFLPPRPSKTAS